MKRVILITILLLGTAELSSAMEWRGIVPLRSTRSDVVRLLNQCSDQIQACRFTLDDANVHILFSAGLSDEYHNCATRLPPDTVMFIAVRPKSKLKLSTLGLDKRTLRYFTPSAPYKLKGYLSSDGLLVSLFEDRIMQIFYLPRSSDEQLCADFYLKPESFVEVPIDHVARIHKIDGPGSIKAGELLKVTATSNMNEILGYEWRVTVGRIVSGQYTNRVTVDTTGLAGQLITITAEIHNGFHAANGSISVHILPN